MENPSIPKSNYVKITKEVLSRRSRKRVEQIAIQYVCEGEREREFKESKEMWSTLRLKCALLSI